MERRHRVAFYNADGTFLGECCVPYGARARTPQLPRPPKGMRFDRWEPQVAFVFCDMQTRAVYAPKEYLVTYLSETGAVLKREYVPHGKDSTPPKYILKPLGQPAAWSAPTKNIQRHQVFHPVFEGQVA